MFDYRITKYNPANRNRAGSYTKNEWTSFGDIGSIFDNELLSFDAYHIIEDAYIEAIENIMDFLKQETLYLSGLEINVDKANEICGKHSQEMINLLKELKEEKELSRNEVCVVARMILRNYIWGKLQNENMFVHFGYDYYMYIGSAKPLPAYMISAIGKAGLFVEEFESPYHEEMADEDISN